MFATDTLLSGPADSQVRFLFAHGAGQDADSPFMRRIADHLADAGIRVIRFRFPYMARSERDARRRPPDREPVLIDAFADLIERHRGADVRLLIGGKSMGGRIASLLADASPVQGLICLGYPFHPPGKPQQLRVAHLATLRTPTLICQGERDPFGNPAEVGTYALSPAVRLVWISDGEHSYRPRKQSGRCWEDNLVQAAEAVRAFALPRALEPH